MENLSTTELRIGNHVRFGDNNYQIEQIIKRNGKYALIFENLYHGVWIDEVEPIELTKDFFRKNRNATGWSDATEMIYIGFLDGAIYECEDNKEAVYVDICSYVHLEEVKPTRYLHELQNLYYAITKEELEVQL